MIAVVVVIFAITIIFILTVIVVIVVIVVVIFVISVFLCVFYALTIVVVCDTTEQKQFDKTATIPPLLLLIICRYRNQILERLTRHRNQSRCQRQRYGYCQTLKARSVLWSSHGANLRSLSSVHPSVRSSFIVFCVRVASVQVKRILGQTNSIFSGQTDGQTKGESDSTGACFFVTLVISNGQIASVVMLQCYADVFRMSVHDCTGSLFRTTT